MELLLTVLAWIVGLTLGLPFALILGVLAIYIVFLLLHLLIVFITGIACIPIAIVQCICERNKNKEERDEV